MVMLVYLSHTKSHVLTSNLVAMENWVLRPRVFAVRRYFVTKSLVRTQRHFWRV